MKTFFLLIAAGIISTMVMDIGGALLRTSGFTAGAPPELIGKWIESAIGGQVFVDDIRSSPDSHVPISKFLMYHYIIGISLTFLFYFIISLLKIKPMPLWVPLLYGLATTLIPALLMYPGMGFGTFGSKGPAEYLLLRTALLNHFLFGIGLTLAFRWLFRKEFFVGSDNLIG